MLKRFIFISSLSLIFAFLFLFDGFFVLSKDIGVGIKENIYKSNEVGVYILNLDKAADRLQAISPYVSALNYDLIRISAVDGKKLDENYISLITDLTTYRKFMKKEPETGTIGCYLSHVMAWEEFLKSKYEYALILEDDVSFDPDKVKRAINGLIRNKYLWDLSTMQMLHRGGPIEIAKLDNDMNLVLYKYQVTSSGAYIINRHAARQLLLHKYPLRMPVDHYFSRTWELDIKFTGVEPRFIYQTFGDSYITDHNVKRYRDLYTLTTSLVFYGKSAIARLFSTLSYIF